MNQASEPQTLFQLFDHLFGNKTPFQILGVPENATHREVRAGFFTEMGKLSGLIKDRGEAHGEYQELKYARDVLLDANMRQSLKQWMKAGKDHAEETIKSAKVYAFPGLDNAKNKLSFNKPLVAVGATIMALGGAYLGIKATERIHHKKEEGEHPSQGDHALQALGFAGVAGAVSAALLMWKAKGGASR